MTAANGKCGGAGCAGATLLSQAARQHLLRRADKPAGRGDSMQIKFSSIFLIFISGIVLIEFLSKFRELKWITGFSDDALLIILMPLFFRGVGELVRFRSMMVSTLLILAWPAIGLLSNLINYPAWRPASYQLLLDSKFLILFVVGFSVVWNGKSESRMLLIAKLILSGSILLIIFQWLSFDTYRAIFTGSVISSVVSQSLHFDGADGLFFQPFLLAYVSAALAVIFFSRYVVYESHSDLWWFLLSTAGTLASFQRQEIAALFVTVSALYWITNRRRFIVKSASLLMTALIAALAVLIFYATEVADISDALRLVLIPESSRLDEDLANVFPRLFFYLYSFQVANEHFPFGYGLGSFGGFASVVYESPLYLESGIASTSWYGVKNYFTDTFWPMPIAEAGWLGAGSLIFAHILIIKRLYTRARRSVSAPIRLLYIRAFGLFLYGMLVSFNAPVHVFITQAIFMVSFVGIAFATERSMRHRSILRTATNQ